MFSWGCIIAHPKSYSVGGCLSATPGRSRSRQNFTDSSSDSDSNQNFRIEPNSGLNSDSAALLPPTTKQTNKQTNLPLHSVFKSHKDKTTLPLFVAKVPILVGPSIITHYSCPPRLFPVIQYGYKFQSESYRSLSRYKLTSSFEVQEKFLRLLIFLVAC